MFCGQQNFTWLSINVERRDDDWIWNFNLSYFTGGRRSKPGDNKRTHVFLDDVVEDATLLE